MDVITWKPSAPSRTRLTALLGLLLAANLACAIHIIGLSSEQTRLKHEAARVNHIRYGLFSVETWKTHLENIVSKSITELKLSPKDKSAVKEEIEKIVKVMITQADSILSQKRGSSRIRRAAYKALVDVPELKRRAPQFAQAVLNEITQPESLEKLRVLALSQLNKYAAATRNGDDGPPLSKILAAHQVKTIGEYNRAVGPRIEALRSQMRTAVGLMMGSAGLLLLLWWVLRDRREFHKTLYALSVALAGIILAASLSVPMLDIDARIQSIQLVLLGEPIQFTDQVLYFRSKSLLDVVQTLMASAKADTLFVGFLLLLFSILFPVAKLTASLVCLFGKERFTRNKWMNFLAYRSGKWSMADVMVVAIFMAYIGFNSILTHQLNGLNMTSDSWQMITTNQTSLQPGFMLFVTFVLLSLALSEILKKVLTVGIPRIDLPGSTPSPAPRLRVVS